MYSIALAHFAPNGIVHERFVRRTDDNSFSRYAFVDKTFKDLCEVGVNFVDVTCGKYFIVPI